MTVEAVERPWEHINPQEILNQLDEHQRCLFRKLERNNQKLNKAKTAVDFNKFCIQNGLLPKYTLSIYELYK